MRSKKFLIFLLLLSGAVQQVYASRSGDARNFLQPITLTEQAKSEIESELAGVDKELKNEALTAQERAVLQLHHDVNTRVLSQTTVDTTAGANNIEFGKGIYDGTTNKLWVFAAQNDGNQGAVGNFFAKRVVGDDTVTFNSAAPQMVTLNGVVNSVNPIYNQEIKEAALSGTGNLPVVLYGAGNNVAALGNAAGTTVFNNGIAIYDANVPGMTAELESAGVALASDRSTNPVIIVAIPQGGSVDSVWGTGDADGMGEADGTYRGFAILQSNGTELVQKDPTNITAQLSQSFQFNLAAKSDANPGDITVAFYQDSVVNPIDTVAMASNDGDGDKATMCRNEVLNRYFVGLQNVSRGQKMGDKIAVATNLDGGVISLLVAGIDAQNAFFLKPILANPVKTAFNNTDDQAIIGFYRESTETADYRANIYRACVMHTSTGRDYMIINGGVAALADVPKTFAEVYALPIMPASSPNAGQLATTHGADAFTLLNAATENLITVDRSHASPDFYPALGTNLFTAAERRAVVGADSRFLDLNQDGVVIEDMYIVGDSVIVAVGGDRSNCEEEAGIFQSTALFDQDGLIVGFTPWQRVGQPYPDAAYAVGFDVKTGNYMYLTTNNLT